MINDIIFHIILYNNNSGETYIDILVTKYEYMSVIIIIIIV